MWFWLVIIIPFLGSVLGSGLVFLTKKQMGIKLEKILLGFAAGVMMAASIWSLLIPSMEMSSTMGKLSFVPAAIGFLLGIIFLLLLDSIVPHLHVNSDVPEGLKSNFKRKTMLVLSLTLHNIPEGMAVGVVLSGVYYGNSIITISGALALAIGIAIQNFPEGAILSLPLKSQGESKSKSFLYGVLSGIVEPIATIVTVLMIGFITPIVPYTLSFAAGAMIYVIVEELIPQSQTEKHSNLATISLAIGFALMMILDVALA